MRQSRRDSVRRRRLSSEGRSAKKSAKKKYEYKKELSREFHSKKGTLVLVD